MKVIYYPYDLHCVFFSEKINTIIIEKKELFEKFIFDLEQSLLKEDIFFYIEENEKELPIEKYALMVVSPLDLRYNKKEFQKILYNKLIEEIQVAGIQEQVVRNYEELYRQIECIANRTDFLIQMDENVDYGAIFKMLNIELEQPKGTFLQKLLDYIKIQMELLHKRIFFVINCAAYISNIWYEEIRKWCEYQGVIIIFVENQQSISHQEINEYILDQDLCEIH